MLKIKTFMYGDKPAKTDKEIEKFVAELYAKGIQNISIFAHGNYITITYNEKVENVEQKD